MIHISINHQVSTRLKKIALIVTLGGLLFGIDTGVINGAIPYMATPQQLNLSPSEEGLVTSGITLGAAFGALIIGKLADLFGRKRMLWVLSLVFLTFTFACSVAPNAILMIIFRFLLGFAVGGASVIVPTYLAEISTAGMRGRLVSQNDLMITGGQLLAFVVNAILGNCFPNIKSIWREMISFGMIPSLALFIGLFFVPESPRWEIMQGKSDQALHTLTNVRATRQQAINEVKSVQTSLARHRTVHQASFRDLKKPWIRRLVFIGMGLGIMQQFVGINIMMYYGTSILMKVGLGHNAALVANIGNGLTSFLATAVGMHLMYTVDRRKMLITGVLGTTISMVAITFGILVFHNASFLPLIVIASTMTFLAFFQSCVSPTTWVLLSEIFPQSLRGLGMGISTFILWLANFAVGFGFPVMMAHIGSTGTFAFFIICNLLSLAFAIAFAPETQGKTLEQIEDELRHAGGHHHHNHFLHPNYSQVKYSH
mgnify:CR=1 FL=1